MKHTNKLKQTLFSLLLLSQLTIYSQTDIKIYDIGYQIYNYLLSDTPEKIIDMVAQDDLDSKATVLESFLKIKEILSASAKLKNYQYFNTVQDALGNIYIIMKNKNKFLTIKVKMNDTGKISGEFKLIQGSINDELSLGEKIYNMKCFSCHGINAKGGLGPNLADNYWKYVNNEQDLINLIKDGKKGTMMMSFKDYLKPQELKAIYLYIKAINGKEVKNAKKPEGEKKKITFQVF